MNKFIFAIHRGGSSILGEVTKACAMGSEENRVVLGAGAGLFAEVGTHGAARRPTANDTVSDDPSYEAFVPQIENWRQHAGVFSPIRRADFFPAEFFAPGDLALLNMRDPRDCMVSGYFGFLRLHGNGLQDADKKAQYEMGIDAYVLTHMLGRYSKALNDYMALRKQIPDMTVLHYEEMVTSFDSWFEKFYAALQFNPAKYDKLLAQQGAHFVPPPVENIDQHKRQMLPGDYARKLEPETIDIINTQMAAQLSYFGYL